MEPCNCERAAAARPCSSPDALTGRGCLKPPEWEVFAAYDKPGDSIHPIMARYPGAMFTVCGAHLTSLLRADATAEGSTLQWVVKRVATH